jgi:predicted transcriptional regulator
MTKKTPTTIKPTPLKPIKAAPSPVVVPITPKADTRKSSEKKYGKPVMDLGFCIVPSLLMQAQARLGINPVQFNIIMHLADIWWEKEHRPWPKKQLLAERMDMSERQIQRQIAELESAGLVQRIERTRPGRGKTSNEYDLSGLVKKLKALEPEFTEMKQENQKRRKNVALPQHRRKA